MITMPIEFAEFEAKCNANGYTNVVDQRTLKSPANIYAMRTRKNIKVEIKSLKKENIYVAGFGLNAENLSLLKEELIQRGMILTKENASHICLKIQKDILDGFFTLVDIIEDIEGIAQRKAYARMGINFNPDKTYLFVAKNLRLAIEMEQPWAIARGMGGLDQVDKQCTVGYSVKGREQERSGRNPYREHMVPCDLQMREAIRMIGEGATDEEVAAMFQANNFILKISDEDAYLLDVTLGLRTVMPEGWQFGDNVYSRITFANIQLEKKVDN